MFTSQPHGVIFPRCYVLFLGLAEVREEDRRISRLNGGSGLKCARILLSLLTCAQHRGGKRTALTSHTQPSGVIVRAQHNAGPVEGGRVLLRSGVICHIGFLFLSRI